MLCNISVARIGRTYNWQVENAAALEPLEAAVARGEPVAVFQEAGRRDWWQALGGWPHFFERVAEWPAQARWRALLVISDRVLPAPPRGLEETTLVFRPPTLTLGIGCRRGVTVEDLDESVGILFNDNRLSALSLTAVASTVSRKKEIGLIDFAEDRQIPFLTYAADKLSLLPRLLPAQSSPRKLHIAHACEPAAMLAAGVKELVVPKTVFPRLTLAVARRPTG